MYGSYPGLICNVSLVKVRFNVAIICFSLHELFIIIINVVVEGIILELPCGCYRHVFT
jgi:hypothetical protein